MGKKLGRLAYQTVLALMMVLCLIIGIGTVKSAQDKLFAKVLSPSLRLLFPLLIAGLSCLFVVLLYRALNRFSRGQLIAASAVMLGVMTGIFLVVFYNFRVSPYTDALLVQDTALYFAKTGKVPLTLNSLHGSYFGRYANNYFLTVVLRCYFKLCLLLGIRDMYWPLILLSYAALMVSVLFMYLTGVLLGGLRKGAKLLALCVMNPLYYLLVLWVYTNVLSIPFLTAGLYFGLRVWRAKNARSRGIFCVLTAIAAVLGYYIRPISAIPAIAFAVCAFLWGLRGKKNMLRALKCAALCAVIALVLFKAVGRLNDLHFAPVSGENFPVSHWLMMASHGDGKFDEQDVAYTMRFDTVAERSKADLKKTFENYGQFTAAGLASFLYRKILAVWSFGDGGDLLKKVSQDNRMTKLYSWLAGSQADLFRTCGYGFRIATLFLMFIAIWNLIRKKEIDPAQFVILLSLFGGILFYCFWEVKSTYSLPFIYLMLAVASHGADVLAVPANAREKETRGALRPAAAALSLVCALVVCALAYRGIIRSNVTLRDWSLNSKKNASMSDILPDARELELTQEVYLSKPFRSLVIAGDADETAVSAGDSALLTIRDESGQIVFERTIGARELKEKNYLRIETGEIVPDGREKFVIGITKSGDCQGRMFFRCRSNRYLDLYDGVLTVNGEKHKSDLFLQIFKEYEGPWCSVKTARILFGALALGILLLYLWMYLDAGRERGRKN